MPLGLECVQEGEIPAKKLVGTLPSAVGNGEQSYQTLRGRRRKIMRHFKEKSREVLLLTGVVGRG